MQVLRKQSSPCAKLVASTGGSKTLVWMIVSLQYLIQGRTLLVIETRLVGRRRDPSHWGATSPPSGYDLCVFLAGTWQR